MAGFFVFGLVIVVAVAALGGLFGLVGAQGVGLFGGFEVRAGNQKPDDFICNIKCLFNLGDIVSWNLNRIKNIYGKFLLGNGIGQLALAPIVGLGDVTAVIGNNFLNAALGFVQIYL